MRLHWNHNPGINRSGKSATRRQSDRWPEPDLEQHGYATRWIGSTDTYFARWDRSVAWGEPGGPIPPWRFQPDGSTDVYVCFTYHIVLVDELLYGAGPVR